MRYCVNIMVPNSLVAQYHTTVKGLKNFLHKKLFFTQNTKKKKNFIIIRLFFFNPWYIGEKQYHQEQEYTPTFRCVLYFTFFRCAKLLVWVCKKYNREKKDTKLLFCV